MNKIFILEDDEKRIENFVFGLKKRFGMVSLYVARDVEHAKELYANNHPFSIIFLDHDLGGRQMADSSDPNTGYQFAKWLTQNYTINNQVIIHSMNIAGAVNIHNLIPGSNVIPYSQLISSLLRG